MAATEPQLQASNYRITELQLKQWEPDPWPIADYPREPKTPSEWFSKMFPEQAKIYGTPFIEHVQDIGDGLKGYNPLAINTDFFAGILGGNSKLGHKVVYVESECAWFYYDSKDRIYKQTTDEKLGNLLRALLMRCAEELPGNVHKFNMFLDFRSDKTIRAIVHRAKSILAADSSYFSVESKHQRQQGPELYERVARAFVEQALERIPGETLTLTDAYVHFCEYLKNRGMEPVNRRLFKDLVPPVVKQEYDLGIRNDLRDNVADRWHAGWKGIRVLDLSGAGQ
jgi:hypothetical protein